MLARDVAAARVDQREGIERVAGLVREASEEASRAAAEAKATVVDELGVLWQLAEAMEKKTDEDERTDEDRETEMEALRAATAAVAAAAAEAERAAKTAEELSQRAVDATTKTRRRYRLHRPRLHRPRLHRPRHRPLRTASSPRAWIRNSGRSWASV